MRIRGIAFGISGQKHQRPITSVEYIGCFIIGKLTQGNDSKGANRLSYDVLLFAAADGGDASKVGYLQ